MENDLISRSALHAIISLDTKHGTYGELMDGSEVSYTSNEVHAMINEAPAVDAVPKWISVKDRLPEVRVPVLTLGRKGAIGIGFIQPTSVKDGKVWFYPRYGDSLPTHWMPLPYVLKED